VAGTLLFQGYGATVESYTLATAQKTIHTWSWLARGEEVARRVSLREWLAGRAGGVYAAASGLIEAARRLRGRVEGRELSELAGDEALLEILLGGFDPESGEPYRPDSLARLYRDLYGVQVLAPRLLALRLRDGLPVALAGRGVKIAWERTRLLTLAEQLAEAARVILESLGVEPPAPLRYEPSEPSWGVEAARRLAEEAARSVPPYSREASVLFAASAPAPLGILEAMGAQREELEGLGCSVAASLPGSEAPGSAGALRLLCSPAGLLAAYRCLALGSMRLLQLDEVRRFFEVPDPLGELVEQALREAGDQAAQLAQLAEGVGQRLPLPGGCRVEAPVLPLGAWSYRMRLRIVDVEVLTHRGDQVGTYMDLVEALAPMLYRGLAGLEPAAGGGDAAVEALAWFVAPQRG